MDSIHDTSCGKMCRVHSALAREKTLDASLRKLLKQQTKPTLCLCLKKESGCTPDKSWVTAFLSLGAPSMHNSGESPNVAEESTLSQILEASPPEKYYLSQKACMGILRRAKSRGKELPKILEEALITQSALNSEQFQDSEQNQTQN